MQDFTTFTDVDVPGRLTQIAARSTFMGLRGNDADVYLYKNIVGTLSTNFSQEFEFYIDAADPTEGDRSVALVSYVQDLDDWEANRAGNKNQISVMVDNVAAGPAPRVALVETNGGTVYTSATTYNPSMDTLFYCTFTKVGTTVTLYIFSNAARTTLVATLTLTLQAGWGITYVMAPQSNGSGDADEISGYIQDMDDPQSYGDLAAEFQVGQDSAELLGNAEVGQNSADLLGNAIIRQSGSAELLGNAIIRHVGTPVELLGNAVIRHDGTPVELLGNLDITHSVDLLGNAIIRQSGSAELLGNAVIRHDGTPVELLGRFEAQATVELLGNAIIRQSGSAELLGNAVIRHVGTPAELLGRFEAQATVELLGKVDITHSVDLLCNFRTSIPDDWIVQGVSVEAYIALSIVV